MTDIEQKAEEYANMQAITSQPRYQIKCAYKDGYKQGQKDYTQFVNDYNSLYGKGVNKCRYNEFAKLKAQIAELKGYKRVIDNLKSEGFDSVMSIKDYITKTKEEIADLRQSLDFANEREKENLETIRNLKKELEK